MEIVNGIHQLRSAKIKVKFEIWELLEEKNWTFFSFFKPPPQLRPLQQPQLQPQPRSQRRPQLKPPLKPPQWQQLLPEQNVKVSIIN